MLQRRGPRVSGAVLIAATVGGIIWASAGDLNPPPGAVTSTMKTLTEVEPRTAVNAINTPGDGASVFVISQPGSYYLTSNVSGSAGLDGIRISGNRVTLDLNGFTLDGGGGQTAIQLSCVVDCTIRNGFIANWGNGGLVGEDSDGLRLGDLHFRNVSGDTVLVGVKTVVMGCSILGSGSGFQLGSDSWVERCEVNGSGFAGVSTASGSHITMCVFRAGTGDGIRVSGNGSTISECLSRNNGGAGIRLVGATASDNRITNNHIVGNAIGLMIVGTGNDVAENTVSGNADNYDFAQGNHLNLLLSEVPETIDWPARVRLAGSLTGVAGQHGITINADNITIDLAGHTLGGVADSLDGITDTGVERLSVAVSNGSIRDWGGSGVNLAASDSCRFANLDASSNGIFGLRSRNEASVHHCSANDNGSEGIRTQGGGPVEGCIAFRNGGAGIFSNGPSTITGCTAVSNLGDGFWVNASTITDCAASSNFGNGFKLSHRNTITNCTANWNRGDGISAAAECLILSNTCSRNGAAGEDGAGILVNFANTRVEGNNVAFNDRGIDVDGTLNLIVKNSAGDNNEMNYDIAAGNNYGPIIDLSAGGDMSTVTNADHPWANFEYNEQP